MTSHCNGNHSKPHCLSLSLYMKISTQNKACWQCHWNAPAYITRLYIMSIEPENKAIKHLINSYDQYWKRKRKLALLWCAQNLLFFGGHWIIVDSIYYNLHDRYRTVSHIIRVTYMYIYMQVHWYAYTYEPTGTIAYRSGPCFLWTGIETKWRTQTTLLRS